MKKPADPRELAIDLIERSPCQIKVAAVLCDSAGNIISWGWNHPGNGFGKHAEVFAIERSNRRRRYAGTIYVAGRYERNTLVLAKPCPACRHIIDKYLIDVIYRDKGGKWRKG